MGTLEKGGSREEEGSAANTHPAPCEPGPVRLHMPSSPRAAGRDKESLSLPQTTRLQ